MCVQFLIRISSSNLFVSYLRSSPIVIKVNHELKKITGNYKTRLFYTVQFNSYPLFISSAFCLSTFIMPHYQPGTFTVIMLIVFDGMEI